MLALVLGALVGLERERKERSAGMRTNALVALGSSLFTIISAFGFADLLGTAHIQLDPTRIASYVVAGIGFLGGGSIIVLRDTEKVKGLTTAAAIWMVAAIGMACGAGMLVEAATGTVLTLMVLIVLRFVERRFLQHRELQHLRVETSSGGSQFVSQLYHVCTRPGVTVEGLEVRKEQGSVTIEVACAVADTTTLTHMVGDLQELPGVHAVYADMHDIGKEEVVPGGARQKAS
jgi:putative Mg2+ transporter-C (MgtC) family protein